MTRAPAPTDADIERAATAGAGVVKRTPLVTSTWLTERCGGEVVLKAENLQRTGSFKIRGALSKLAALGEEAARGVVAGDLSLGSSFSTSAGLPWFSS